MDLPGTLFATTSDGVRLKYAQAGSSDGQQILFLTGWCQASSEWRNQVEYFSLAGFRVTTHDMHGHGESEKPDFGYRISRFAADLNDLLTQLNLEDLTIVAHSMGCSVTWAWWDQYPADHKRLDKLVLVDQPATMVRHPSWTDTQAVQFGTLFTPERMYELANNLAAHLRGVLKGFFTPSISEADFEWVLSENGKMSDAHATALLVNHGSCDWRDVIPRIAVPALVLGGLDPAPGIEWIAAQIPGARHYSFTAADKGYHFVFSENPDKFNAIVREFIAK